MSHNIPVGEDWAPLGRTAFVVAQQGEQVGEVECLINTGRHTTRERAEECTSHKALDIVSYVFLPL